MKKRARSSRALRGASLALALACAPIALIGCGERDRPCVEHEECFADEYCNHNNICRPYDGSTRTEPR